MFARMCLFARVCSDGHTYDYMYVYHVDYCIIPGSPALSCVYLLTVRAEPVSIMCAAVRLWEGGRGVEAM